MLILTHRQRLKTLHLKSKSSSEKNYEDLQWCHKLLSDKADRCAPVYGRLKLAKQPAVPNISENSQYFNFFSLYD
jgi:hypothetical protein